MKKTAFTALMTLVLAGALNANADTPTSTPCPKPQPDASTLFSMIGNSSVSAGAIRDFLQSHAVGWDAVNENCQTPFLLSIADNRGDVFQILYSQYKVDLNQVQPHSHDSIYSYTLRNGTIDTLKVIKSEGETLSLETIFPGNKITELMVAAVSNPHSEMIDYLLENGNSINAKDSGGETAIFYAVSNKNLDVTQRLLAHRPELNKPNHEKITVLEIAASVGPAALINMLVHAGATITPDIATNMLASEAGRKDGDASIMKQMIRDGATVTGSDLTSAVQADNLEVVQLLIQGGAPISGDGKEKAPLYAAIDRGDPAAVKMIVKAGASVNTSDTDEADETPLVVAIVDMPANVPGEVIVPLLIQAGASINQISPAPLRYPDDLQNDGQNKTASEWLMIECADNGYTDQSLTVAKELVAAGADTGGALRIAQTLNAPAVFIQVLGGTITNQSPPAIASEQN
jgi:uncharacterized protein